MQKSLWDDLPKQVRFIEEDELTKTCKNCGVKQPLENFHSQYYKIDGSKSYRNTCITCKNQQKIVVNKLRQLHGPPPNVCECCGKPPTMTNYRNKRPSLVVDHCHTTHKFRGWLCTSCNVALGHLKDSPEIIMKLYKYMTKEK